MNTDIHSSTCPAGSEAYEAFWRNGRQFIRYDYCGDAGETYACVAPTLALCRAKREIWQRAREIHGTALIQAQGQAQVQA